MRLATEQAPAACVPRRFTNLAVAWGIAAGLWLGWHGESVVVSRWAPATLALVHIWALGVLGNAMLGSLWQFLPVVAGVQVPGRGLATAAMLVFNTGIVALIAGFVSTAPWLLGAGGVATLVVLGAVAMRLLSPRGAGRTIHPVARLMRLPGLALLLALAVAALLVMQRLTDSIDGAHLRLVDVHATLAALGWGLGLVWVVGSVVGPMFQSLPPPRPRLLGGVLGSVLGLLLLAGAAWYTTATGWPLRVTGGVTLLVSGLGYLGALARARHARNLPLKAAWAIAAACLCVAAAVGWTGTGTSAAAWVLAALWLVLVSMLVEIRSFLAWLDLQQRCGRGVRLPGIHALWPDRRKWCGLAFHASAALLSALAFSGVAALLRTAGALTVAAFALTTVNLWQLRDQAVDT